MKLTSLCQTLMSNGTGTACGIQFRAAFSIAAAVGLVLAACCQLDGQTQTPTIQRIDESKLVTLSGHTHPAAIPAANDRGPVPDETRMDRVWLLLKRPPEKQKPQISSDRWQRATTASAGPRLKEFPAGRIFLIRFPANRHVSD